MKRFKLLLAVFALIVPFLLSLACGSSGPPSIGDVVMAKGLDENYKPIDVTTSYQPEETIYTSVQVTDLVVGSTVKIQYKLNGDLYEESTLTAKESGSGAYGFSLKPPSNFGHTPGSYTVELYLDDVLVKTVAFTVEGDAEAKILEVVLAESLNSDGSPVNPTTSFKPNDVVSVSVAVSNVQVGAEVKVVYSFAGSQDFGASTSESTTTAKEAGSGFFGFTFSPTADGHAVGDYTVEVYLDGVQFGAPLSFTISE